MAVVVNQVWPVGDAAWGPVPDQAQQALAKLFLNSRFRALLAQPSPTPAAPAPESPSVFAAPQPKKPPRRKQEP